MPPPKHYISIVGNKNFPPFNRERKKMYTIELEIDKIHTFEFIFNWINNFDCEIRAVKTTSGDPIVVFGSKKRDNIITLIKDYMNYENDSVVFENYLNNIKENEEVKEFFIEM